MEEELQPLWQQIQEWALTVYGWFTATLFEIGSTPFSLFEIIFFVLSVILLIYLSGKLRSLLVERILTRYNLDIGIRQSIGTIVRYVILVLGVFIIIQSAGIDLSALSVLVGALGVGIGFGLQNIANNFISGLIILFERPIKVGDRIEVGDVNGDVVDISARATTVITNDNISIIVPNSQFISSPVTNWSHHDRRVRFRFPVGVSYKEDPEVVRQLLMEVMNEHTGVLKSPPPDVWFSAFGDSSLNFNMMIWSTQYVQRPEHLRSQLYFAIFKKFKEHGIEIPFPQRDLHIRSGLPGGGDDMVVSAENNNGNSRNDG